VSVSSDPRIGSELLGGSILETTWDLDFIEGTGVYRSFVGGHELMIDSLHFLENGDVDEYCFCHVSGP